jgi:C1A family cysteine protease
VEEMKAALDNGPVIAHIVASSNAFRNYGGGILDKVDDCYQRSTELDHAVLIIGYGKEAVKDEFSGLLKTAEYFIVKNSFGSHWGENGLAKIATKDNSPYVVNEGGVCGILRQPFQVVVPTYELKKG